MKSVASPAPYGRKTPSNHRSGLIQAPGWPGALHRHAGISKSSKVPLRDCPFTTHMRRTEAKAAIVKKDFAGSLDRSRRQARHGPGQTNCRVEFPVRQPQSVSPRSEVAASPRLGRRPAPAIQSAGAEEGKIREPGEGVLEVWRCACDLRQKVAKPRPPARPGAPYRTLLRAIPPYPQCGQILLRAVF